MSKDCKTRDSSDLASMPKSQRNSPSKRKKTCEVGKPKTKTALLRQYHVDKSVVITNDTEACYFGGAPTLWDANNTYGAGTSEEWLIYQLSDLSEFTGVGKKISAPQISQMAQLIVGDYGYLKMTEVMLFLRRFKIGEYGTFYGNVDPIVIMSSLGRFVVEERNAVLGAREREQAKKHIEAVVNDPRNVSYEDYLRMGYNRKKQK